MLRLAFALMTLTSIVCAQTSNDTHLKATDFGKPFGSLTVTDADDGGVILTRTVAGADAGVDWMPGGKSIPLDAAHDSIQIVPAEAIGGGYYVVTILFFDAKGKHLKEIPVVADTNKIESKLITNLKKLAKTQGAATADGYVLRIRIQPAKKVGAAFRFTSISAGPTAK